MEDCRTNGAFRSFATRPSGLAELNYPIFHTASRGKILLILTINSNVTFIPILFSLSDYSSEMAFFRVKIERSARRYSHIFLIRIFQVVAKNQTFSDLPISNNPPRRSMKGTSNLSSPASGASENRSVCTGSRRQIWARRQDVLIKQNVGVNSGIVCD